MRWRRRDIAALRAQACTLYADGDHVARHFCRFKLRHDPVFAIMLSHGLLPARPRILDIGCGQGLLGAWLYAAQRCHPARWPAGWPAPAQPLRYLGLELTPADAARAAHALHGRTPWPTDIQQGDACQALHAMAASAAPRQWDLIVMLDVLHFIDYPAQEALLRDLVRCLAPGGTVLLRVGDAGAGWRARYSQAVDRIVNLVRARRTTPLRCRAAEDWRQLLRGMGFQIREVPLPADAHGANVLMVLQRRPSAANQAACEADIGAPAARPTAPVTASTAAAASPAATASRPLAPAAPHR